MQWSNFNPRFLSIFHIATELAVKAGREKSSNGLNLGKLSRMKMHLEIRHYVGKACFDVIYWGFWAYLN